MSSRHQRELIASETEAPRSRMSRDFSRTIYFRYQVAGELLKGKDVLEIGCGPGVGCNYLSSRARSYVGADFHLPSLEAARTRLESGGNLVCLDAHTLPFPAERFDVVVALTVALYLRLDEFLSECHRVLCPGGTLFFCMPNKDIPGFVPSPYSVAYLSPSGLMASVERHGFEGQIFGAFPITRSLTAQRLRATLRAAVKWLALSLPGGERIKSALKHAEEGVKDTVVLDDNIPETLGPPEQLVPLEAIGPSYTYRILYTRGVKAHPRLPGQGKE